jgi:hypothetical protein
MIISIKHTLYRAFVLLFLFSGLRQMSAQSSGAAAIHKDMVYNLNGVGDAYALVDQNTATVFQPKHFNNFEVLPAEVVLRLKPGATNQLSHINFHAAPGARGRVQLFVGTPGHWLPLSTLPMDYGNGITGLAWYPIMQNVEFIKAIFTPQPADTQPLATGELYFTISGDYAYTDQDGCPNGQANCRTASTTFGEYMGVNNFLGKTQLIHQFAPFTAIREYLPWDHVQGHMLSGTSTYSDDHLFRYSPAFPGYDIDRHYTNLASMGKDLLIDFKESSPFQMYFDYQGGQGTTLNQLGLSYNQLGGAYLELMERKPGRPEGGVQPNSLGFQAAPTYANHAEAVFQTALRYGTGGNASKNQFADASTKANQGTAKWIENWNEQDKWWSHLNIQSPVNGANEKRLQFFSPKEYMAMTFADKYAQSGQPALPMVMSGLAELDVEYLKGMYMAWWELTKINPSQNGNWPFKAINYHHYSVENWQRGIAPEKDFFMDGSNPYSHLSRINSFVNKYLTNSELWITEFGYSDHPQDVTSAHANYPNADFEAVQAEWILRSYLQYYRHGIDRAFAYQLVDDGPNQWASVFNHTGFIDRTDGGGGAPEYKYKKAWYYTYTLKQYLDGMRFDAESNSTTAQGRPLRRYDFNSVDNQRKISALWVPDDTNPTKGSAVVATNGRNKGQIIRFTPEKIEGTTEPIIDTDNDGFITINGVGELPILILWDTIALQVASCGCNTPYSLSSGPAAAFQALTDAKDQMLQTEHPKCNYGPQSGSVWESGQTETLTLNIGGGSTTDIWQVDGLYLNDPAWNSGTLHIEFLDSTGSITKTIQYQMDGEVQYPFNVQGANYVWKTFDGIAVNASQMRITKSGGVRLGELVLCAQPKAGAIAVPSSPQTPITPTPPNTNPGTYTANPAACDCTPFPVKAVSGTYQLAQGQQLPLFNNLSNICYDTVPDKGPMRMFDEQTLQVINKICSAEYDLTDSTADFNTCLQAHQNGFPYKEWFPGWSNKYPFRAIVTFDHPIEFKGLFIYDSNDEGDLTFEYRENTSATWKTLSMFGNKTHRSDSYRNWHQVFSNDHLLTAAQLRVTMGSQSARFAELAFCGPKELAKAVDVISEEDYSENQTDMVEEGRLRQMPQSAAPQAISLTSGAWRVYPNPADLFVNIEQIPSEVTHFTLSDMTGRMLGVYPNKASGRNLSIPIEQLPTGVYILSGFVGELPAQMERVIVK